MKSVAQVWLLLMSILATTAVGSDDRIRDALIASAALGRTLPVTIVAPAHPTPDSSVLFFLHGRGRNHRSLVDSPAARAALLAAPFYVVLPQGEDGWYIDSPARPADRYGAYLGEVVAWAERILPLGAGPARRGIAGWSMGGYGAVRFAETHPGRFGFVASAIGLLDFPCAEILPQGQNYHVPADRFTADPATWRELNPLTDAGALRGSVITLVLSRLGFERTMNEHFAAELARRHIPARVHWLDGGHEFAVVERAVPLVLTDAAAFFSAAEDAR
jgi:S-formylglutathione hydrolase FrmB